jgi:hypothetical protein
VAIIYTTKEMKEDFIDDQKLIGKICACMFYAIAWGLKGFRFVISKVIK